MIFLTHFFHGLSPFLSPDLWVNIGLRRLIFSNFRYHYLRDNVAIFKKNFACQSGLVSREKQKLGCKNKVILSLTLTLHNGNSAAQILKQTELTTANFFGIFRDFLVNPLNLRKKCNFSTDLASNRATYALCSNCTKKL